MIAVYTRIDDDAFAELVSENEMDCELSDDDGSGASEDLDKFWDPLHVALTGAVTFADPPAEGPLSEAIRGVREVDPDKETDVIGVVPRDDVPRILAALRAVDVDQVFGELNPSASVRAETDPAGIWDIDGIGADLAEAFGLLLALYEKAAESGQHVAVSLC